MFSELGSLFKTTFRQAEANDARQHIPHNERDNGHNKKKDKNENRNNDTLWEDTTGVSVNALHLFLIDFIKSKPETSTLDFSQSETIKGRRPPQSSRPTSTQNAKAVRAYQAMANHTPPREQIIKTDVNRNENDKSNLDMIKSQELRDIYKLIKDLELLSNNNIMQLKINPAGSFVESLKNAVKVEKSNL